MEFVTAQGSVQLRPTVDAPTLLALIDAFVSAPVQDGHVLVSHAHGCFELDIDCCLDARAPFYAALDRLEQLIDAHSFIQRQQQRWEMAIRLGCRDHELQ